MARTAARPEPTQEQVLEPLADGCPHCGRRMWADYQNRRTVTTLNQVLRLRLSIRRCPHADCPRFHKPYRPEAEGAIALPEHEFGLDVIALVGALRYGQHRSVPEIHRELAGRGVAVCQRTVTNLLDRYDELLALSLQDERRLRKLTGAQGRVILALDGLQPDVGHEVLWVLRDCLSGEVLLARSLLSATEADLAALIGSVQAALGAAVPISAVVSDGQRSIRNAVRRALPGVPHHLCHFHYLREAGRPLYEMDRHAKKELKKRVRGVRKIERAAESGKDEDRQQARATQRYCAAVRGAITDDGRPPLEASGLKLQGRLRAIDRSLGRLEEKGAAGGGLMRLKAIVRGALDATAPLWPPVRNGYGWFHRAARILKNERALTGTQVRQRLGGLLGAIRRDRPRRGLLADATGHFLKVTASYWEGLFHCYDVPGLPRTNNDLEHLFGSNRYHERRATGRKAASPALVLRGPVRLLAATATRLKPPAAPDLAPADTQAWRDLRKTLDQRRATRTLRRRFRRDPEAYLRQTEEQLLKPALPP